LRRGSVPGVALCGGGPAFPGRVRRALREGCRRVSGAVHPLEKHGRFRIEPVPQGSNIVKLHVKDVNGPKYREALKRRDILVNDQSRDVSGFLLVVNESVNRRPVDELAKGFIAALSE